MPLAGNHCAVKTTFQKKQTNTVHVCCFERRQDFLERKAFCEFKEQSHDPDKGAGVRGWKRRSRLLQKPQLISRLESWLLLCRAEFTCASLQLKAASLSTVEWQR